LSERCPERRIERIAPGRQRIVAPRFRIGRRVLQVAADDSNLLLKTRLKFLRLLVRPGLRRIADTPLVFESFTHGKDPLVD
jgi:hypothetical protein